MNNNLNRKPARQALQCRYESISFKVDPCSTMLTKASGRKGYAGFTIVELMIVVVILGLLAGAVVVNLTGYVAKSRKERARMDIVSLKNAVELFYLQYKRYPTNDEGLAKLTKRSADHPSGLISALAKDPWGQPYIYACPGQHGAFDVLSFGRNGVQGGSGEDADIVSWRLDAEAGEEPE